MSRLLWPELAPEDQAGGWLREEPPVTSAEIAAAVGRRHPMDGFNGMPGRWVFVREVQASTGAYADVQRFDAVAVGLVPSVKYARVVYEIKISRSDWLRELRPLTEVSDQYGRLSRRLTRAYETGEAGGLDQLRAQGYTVREHRKWHAALDVSTELWIAAPPRCVLVDELPAEAGLLEVRPWGPDRELRARVVRAAPVRQTPIPDAGFWAAVLRRAAERQVVAT